jgi:hypothetical protein
MVGFDVYQVIVKTIRMIAQIFVAFSEKLNFTFPSSQSSNKNPRHYEANVSLKKS